MPIIVNVDVMLAKRKMSSAGKPVHPQDRQGEGRAIHYPGRSLQGP